MAEESRFHEPGGGSEEALSFPMTAWNEGAARQRSASFPRQAMAGQEDVIANCARGNSDCTTGRISSLKGY